MKVIFPENEKIVKRFVDRDVDITGKKLKEESAKWKNWLISGNVIRLGICMGNCPEFLFAVFGALRAGIPVVLVPVSGNMEIPPCTLVYDADNKHVSRRDGIDVHQIQFSDWDDTTEDYNWAKNEVIIYSCTSGTTGERKWIGKTFDDYYPHSSVKALRSLGKMFQLRVFNTSPWYHNTGISVFLLLALGIDYLEFCMDSFHPIKAKTALIQYHPSIWIGTSSMLHRICVSDNRESCIAKINILTGEAISLKQLKSFERTEGFGMALCTYGTTETGGVASMCCVGEKNSLFIRFFSMILCKCRIAGTSRKIAEIEECMVGDLKAHVQVQITDADENGIGHICAKTMVTAGKTESGFYDTGDLGYVKGKTLYVVGRNGNIINRSGAKIMSSDIEKIIRSFSGVLDVAAFGIPSEMYGEEICLAVEGVLTSEQIQSALPKRWWPRFIVFFDKMPLNASGKRDLKKISEMFQNGQCQHIEELSKNGLILN